MHHQRFAHDPGPFLDGDLQKPLLGHVIGVGKTDRQRLRILIDGIGVPADGILREQLQGFVVRRVDDVFDRQQMPEILMVEKRNVAVAPIHPHVGIQLKNPAADGTVEAGKRRHIRYEPLVDRREHEPGAWIVRQLGFKHRGQIGILDPGGGIAHLPHSVYIEGCGYTGKQDDAGRQGGREKPAVPEKLEQHPGHRDAAERQNDLNGEGFGVMDIVADPPDFGVQPGKEGEEQGSSERQAASPPESDLLQIVERHGRYQCHHEDQHIHPTEPPIPAQVEHAVQEGNHRHNSQQCHKTRREIPLFQHPRQHHRHAEHGQEEGLGIVVGHICGRETLAVSRQKHGLDHPQIFLPAEPQRDPLERPRRPRICHDHESGRQKQKGRHPEADHRFQQAAGELSDAAAEIGDQIPAHKIQDDKHHFTGKQDKVDQRVECHGQRKPAHPPVLHHLVQREEQQRE